MGRTDTVGVTTRYLGPTNARGSRIKVTAAGRSKVVAYDHSARSAHIRAIVDAWDFFGFGTLGEATYVAESESGRGSVYSVSYEVTA